MTGVEVTVGREIQWLRQKRIRIVIAAAAAQGSEMETTITRATVALITVVKLIHMDRDGVDEAEASSGKKILWPAPCASSTASVARHEHHPHHMSRKHEDERVAPYNELDRRPECVDPKAPTWTVWFDYLKENGGLCEGQRGQHLCRRRQSGLRVTI